MLDGIVRDTGEFDVGLVEYHTSTNDPGAIGLVVDVSALPSSVHRFTTSGQRSAVLEQALTGLVPASGTGPGTAEPGSFLVASGEHGSSHYVSRRRPDTPL